MKSKHKRLKITRGIVMIAIGIILLAISSLALFDKFNYHLFHGRALMAVTYKGGMCSNGPCKSEVYNLYDNGHFEGHKKLSQADVHHLKQIINSTDFTKYGLNPKPSCRSFIDGSDRVLTFPKKHGNQEFTICKLDIASHDQTFRDIEKLIERQV